MAHSITKEERKTLLLASSAIWFPTCGARDEQRDALVDLAVRGLGSQRQSSIGELDEKVHFTITDAGREALSGT